MKCVLLYQNNKENRNFIFNQLVNISKQINLEEQGINIGNIQIVPKYPSKEIIDSIPIGMQVEEVSITDNQITTLKTLVVDVESELLVEKPIVEVLPVEVIPIETVPVDIVLG